MNNNECLCNNYPFQTFSSKNSFTHLRIWTSFMYMRTTYKHLKLKVPLTNILTQFYSLYSSLMRYSLFMCLSLCYTVYEYMYV